MVIEAALIEPIAVTVHALRRGGGVEGKCIVVLGAGTIGNLTAQVAKASGAKAGGRRGSDQERRRGRGGSRAYMA